jgi:transcriptional regulator with XRE-family HTH domain
VEIGTEVRRRRKALDLTIEQLAERASLTPNYVGSVESGKRDPSLSTVVALAKALKVHAADLLGGVDGLGAAGVEAGRLYEAAPGDVQEAVLVLLRAVARRKR